MRLAERPYIESGWISHVGKVVLLAATYWVIAKAALLTAIPPGYATALWPASGVAVAALLVLALFTAVSMTIVTTGFGATLSVPAVARPVVAAAPVLGVTSLAFGVWYAAAAWSLAPYPF